MNLAIVKSGNNKRLYIQKSFRKDGNSSSKNIESLGILSELMKSMNMSEEEVLAWGRKKAKEYTDAEVKENNDVIVKMSSKSLIKKDIDRSINAGYLFLQDIYYDLRFDNTFRNITNKYKFDYDIDAIFSDLVYSRIIEPGSKLSSHQTAKSFLEAPKYELHDVYRALSIIALESDYIQSEIYRNSNLLIKRNNRVLYYDCTNYYFEIEDEDELRKYGKSKEHRPNPIVQMGLLMDGDGIPLAFNIFEGNKNEQLSLKPLEEKIIKEFDFTKFVVCTDAGLASKTNKLFNSILDRAFIITQSLKKLNKKDSEWLFTDTNWKRVSDNKSVKLEDIKKLENDTNIYYKEEPFKDDEISNQRLIVTYSPVYAKYQKTIRDKQVARALKIIESGKYRKSRNENDPYRFIIENKITVNGEVADTSVLSFNENQFNDEAKYDGLYGCSTNLEDDVNQIIKIARGRWEIEESFRIMKTDFEARPVYVRRQDRIKAHFLTCYTALLILRILEKKLDIDNVKLNVETKNKKEVYDKLTTQKLVDTLRSYKLLKIDEGYIPEYTRNEITDLLHKTFKFRTDYEINKPSKIRSIIKSTKNK